MQLPNFNNSCFVNVIHSKFQDKFEGKGKFKGTQRTKDMELNLYSNEDYLLEYSDNVFENLKFQIDSYYKKSSINSQIDIKNNWDYRMFYVGYKFYTKGIFDTLSKNKKTLVILAHGMESPNRFFLNKRTIKYGYGVPFSFAQINANFEVNGYIDYLKSIDDENYYDDVCPNVLIYPHDGEFIEKHHSHLTGCVSDEIDIMLLTNIESSITAIPLLSFLEGNHEKLDESPINYYQKFLFLTCRSSLEKLDLFMGGAPPYYPENGKLFR